jgi:hypothetical protein
MALAEREDAEGGEELGDLRAELRRRGSEAEGDIDDELLTADDAREAGLCEPFDMNN